MKPPPRCVPRGHRPARIAEPNRDTERSGGVDGREPRAPYQSHHRMPSLLGIFFLLLLTPLPAQVSPPTVSDPQSERTALLDRLQRARDVLATRRSAEVRARATNEEALAASERRLTRLGNDRAILARELADRRRELTELAARRTAAEANPPIPDVAGALARGREALAVVQSRLGRITDPGDPRRSRLAACAAGLGTDDPTTGLENLAQFLAVLTDEASGVGQIALTPVQRRFRDRSWHGFELRLGWAAWAFVSEDGQFARFLGEDAESLGILEPPQEAALRDAVALLRRRQPPRFLPFPFPKVPR